MGQQVVLVRVLTRLVLVELDMQMRQTKLHQRVEQKETKDLVQTGEQYLKQ